MAMTDVPLQLDLAMRVLSHETRRGIFEALWRASRHADVDDRGLTFSELQDAVDVESGSRLSYHLEQMKDHGQDFPMDSYDPATETRVLGSARAPLVFQRDDRYQIEPVIGRRILQLWALGQPAHDPIGPAEVPWDCPHCGQGLTAAYRHHRLDMWCPDHPEVFFGWTMPGDAVGKSLTDIVRLAAVGKARRYQPLLTGFCNACWGPIETTIVSHEHDEAPLSDALDESVSYPHEVADYAFSLPDHKWMEPFALECRCQRCSHRAPRGLGLLTCYRPQVANYLATHSVDPITEPMVFRYIEHSGTVLSTDPPRVRVQFSVGDSSRRFVVDDSARIVSRGG